MNVIRNYNDENVSCSRIMIEIMWTSQKYVYVSVLLT